MNINIASGIVRSVNVSPVRTITVRADAVPTGILKSPVSGRIALRGVNLAGDDQADRAAHGGPDRALYAYAAEDYAWWRQELERELAPGIFGENLTLEQIDVSAARVGERWRVGSTLLAVTSPRVPCFKLAHVMQDQHFVRAFGRALRPGAYLRVIEEGEIGAGDRVEIVSRPDHRLSVSAMAEIYLYDRTRAGEMLAVNELSPFWREWAIAQRSQ